MEKKNKAAQIYNAYQKIYLGTIFTKQQSGFDPVLLEQQSKPIIPVKVEDDPERRLQCEKTDFDPFIKFGRDNQLFVKREYIERLKDATRYNEDQIKNLKNLYVSYAEIGRGLSPPAFRRFMTAIFNIEGHPFADDFFLFFDTNRDGLVDFYEMVVGMNIVERGTFDEKCRFAFAMYDLKEAEYLDTVSIREVLRKSFVNQIVQIDQALTKIRDFKTQSDAGWQWDEFEREILPSLESSLPIALDRMEFHKSLMNEMEFKYNFTLDSCEHMWNIFKPTLEKSVSENRMKTAAAFAAHPPDMITKEQFKLVLLDVFKVKDAQLLNNLFIISDVNGKGALDIREIIGNMIFWLRGSLGLKFALFFEVFQTVTGTVGCVARENLGKVIGDAQKVFKESFFNAKTLADKMNTNLNGQITFIEFQEYCRYNPQAIDFMCRMTIGPYPLSDELQQRLQEYQAAQMQKYYPQQPMIASMEGESQQAIEPQKDQSTGLAAQMAIAHANMVIATNPNNFHIVPLDDRSKKYSSLDAQRMNFAGVGSQQNIHSIVYQFFCVYQIFNHIRTSQPPELPQSQANSSMAAVNPQKRWLPRE